ncbi:MAG: 3-hydroxyacyl-CoA dehydrogenase NAD-binding domain-containing protein [Burkholderiales bacterium]
MAAADYIVHDGVAVITFNNPPMNTLAHAMREAVNAHFENALRDPAVKSIVLMGSGRAFCAGAEVREFNTPKALASPNTRALLATIEASTKPVVAAIHGFALGGGFELALACHYRVAAPDAQVGLPEVKLGILPGAGGTQRLPRAIGVEKALDMILAGTQVAAQTLAGTPAIDATIPGNLLEGAVAFATKIQGQPLRRLRDLPATVANADVYFASAREKAAKESRGFPAPLKIIDAVEASVKLPFDDGIKVEREGFLHLVETVASKALRHAFFAERQAAKIPDIPDDAPQSAIKSVAIVGAGTMGGGIAMCFANVGMPVKLLDMTSEALDRGMATITKNYAATVQRGRLAQAEMDKRMALIQPVTQYADIREVDLVIEAVFERMDVKKTVFGQLEAVVKPGTILASNTSTLDVDEIAASTKDPSRVIGTHFFSPANVMRLLEIVRGAKTAKPVLATVMSVAKRIKKVGVVSGVCDGFIGNRMVEEYLRQAYFLVEEGALPQQVDQALEDWGMAMGPFRMMDLAGQDIGFEIRKRRRAEDPARQIYPAWLDRVCELGRHGQKTGAGVYKYEKGSRGATPDPVVDKLIIDYSNEIGLPRRQVTDDEIIERCIYALANEAAHILEEGIALRASDIDIVYLTGYGFPLYRGGPMFYADTVGLANVVAAMERYAKRRNGQFWQPAPMIAKLAAEGRRFNQ